MMLDEPDDRSSADWATDCAGRVLPYFEEERPEDDRPGGPSRRGWLGRAGR